MNASNNSNGRKDDGSNQRHLKQLWRSAVVLIIAAILTPPAQAEPDGGALRWVRTYNGFSNGADDARGVKVDSKGNIVVFGQSFGDAMSYYDYVVRKYTPAGALLWSQRINGVDNHNGLDEPKAMTLDVQDNVIVTGLSLGTRGIGLPDIMTVKLDTNGVIKWKKRYFLGDTGHEAGNAVAADAAGNIYVAGKGSSTVNTYHDAVLIKYSPTGTQLWARRYNGLKNDNDEFLAVGVDTAGNAYVTGYTLVSYLNFQDVIVQKYSPAGTVLWTRLYNGTASIEDWGESLTLDPQGNVIVTGSRGEGCSGNVCYSFLTLKYAPNGARQWVRIYNPLPQSDDLAHAVVANANGEVYVTGQSAWKSAFYDYATVKYSPTGAQLWVKRYDGPGKGDDKAYGLALDKAGNALVTGASYTNLAVYSDWATLKYTPSGAVAWTTRYDGPGHQMDMAFGVAAGPDGSVYAAGFSNQSATGDDLTLIKYAP